MLEKIKNMGYAKVSAISFGIIFGLLIIGFSLFGYHKPLKLTENNKQQIIELLQPKLGQDSLIENSIWLDLTESVDENFNEYQMVHYEVIDSNTNVTAKHNAILLKKKILGYNILDIK